MLKVSWSLGVDVESSSARGGGSLKIEMKESCNCSKDVVVE